MSKGDSLGEFEQLVLLALVRLADEAYGLAVLREIGERTGRALAIGAVYATLDRLEEKRLVSSEVREGTRQRGGRSKRMFRLTAEGARRLRESQRALASMWEGLGKQWRPT